MDIQVTTLDGKADGSVTLKDDIFGLEPRTDILHRMVRYQQLKAMRGTADVKNRSEGARTGKKFVKQKGSGGARHGDRKAPQFRGGGRAFGPTLNCAWRQR
jgi:large subunit ribosomal protein L4